MIIIRQFDTDDEHDEGKLIYELSGYGVCVMNTKVSDIKQTSVISLEKFYNDYNIPEDMRGKLNNVSNIITFPNGSQILLRE